jgi:hypothetical protein
MITKSLDKPSQLVHYLMQQPKDRLVRILTHSLSSRMVWKLFHTFNPIETRYVYMPSMEEVFCTMYNISNFRTYDTNISRMTSTTDGVVDNMLILSGKNGIRETVVATTTQIWMELLRFSMCSTQSYFFRDIAYLPATHSTYSFLAYVTLMKIDTWKNKIFRSEPFVVSSTAFTTGPSSYFRAHLSSTVIRNIMISLLSRHVS